MVYALKALMDGADGVLVGGCHPGDCHYQSGNFKARRRVAILRNTLAQLGIPEERVWLRWPSRGCPISPSRFPNTTSRAPACSAASAASS